MLLIIMLLVCYLYVTDMLQFAAMSMSGHNIAVAGKSGLAHYSLFSRKWKLFGNETQVRNEMLDSLFNYLDS